MASIMPQKDDIEQFAHHHVGPKPDRQREQPAKWLTSLDGSMMSGAIAGTGPRKCFPWPTGPCFTMPDEL